MSKLWGWLSLPQGFIIETKPHYWRQLSLTYWYIWLISKGVWFAVFMCACSKWELLICVGEEWVVAFSMWNMSLHGNVTNLPEQQCCLHVYICISLLLHFCHAVTWIIHSVALLPSLLAHFSVRLHLIWLECTLHYKIPPLKLDLCFCLFFSLCITLTQNVFCSNFFIVSLKSRIHPFYIWPNIVSQLKLLWNFFENKDRNAKHTVRSEKSSGIREWQLTEIFWKKFCAQKEDRLLSLSFLIIEQIYTVLQGWGDCSLVFKHSFTQKIFTTVPCGKHTRELQSSTLHSFEHSLKLSSWCSGQSRMQPYLIHISAKD